MNRTEMDYYGVLDVPRGATKDEITLAYRKLAIRLCPFRDPKHHRDFVPLANDEEITHMVKVPKIRQWEYINMAYDVLGNELHREIYDRFGEGGLFQGIYLPNGYFPPYQYHGDHEKIYHEVFGSYSPYANFIDVVTKPPILYTSREHGIGVRTKSESVEKTIDLSLEEVCFGSLKLMHVWRQEFIDEKKTMTDKKKVILKVNIPPGIAPGTHFVFKEEGDRYPTKIPGDIIFVTADKPHKVFQRHPTQFENITFEHEIDLCQALVGFKFILFTMDKRKLTVNVNDVVYPGYKKVIPEEGLPKCNPEDGQIMVWPAKKKDRGDLIINFTIKFPIYLDPVMKVYTRSFFKVMKEREAESQQLKPTASR